MCLLSSRPVRGPWKLFEKRLSVASGCQLSVVRSRTCRFNADPADTKGEDSVVDKSFVWKILPVTPFDGIFCEGEFYLPLCFQYFAQDHRGGGATSLSKGPPVTS